MSAIPLIRASTLRPMLDFLERRGAPIGPILGNARALLRDPTALVPVVAAGALIAEAERVSECAAFGLRAGEATWIGDIGDWGAVLSQAATLGGALEIVITASRRFNTGQILWVARHGSDVWFCRRSTSQMQQGRRSGDEFALMLILQALRAAAGPTWRPAEIHMEGAPPPHAEEIAALARKRVLFEQPQLALVFPAHTLKCRYPAGAFPNQSAQAAPEPAGDFETSARQVVAALVKLGTPELRVAAEMAGMSERSFQRRLSERGLRFLRLVEAARFDLASRMLSDPARKVVEISTALGYTDSANFTRAFRRWTGVAPQTFRQAR